MSYFHPDIDSPKSLMRIPIGLVLLVFLGLAIIGGERLWFIIAEGAPTEPVRIDLSKDDLRTIPPKGYLEITGYPRVEVSDESGMGNPLTRQGWDTTKEFYFSLHPSAETAITPVIVIRKYYLLGTLWSYYDADEKKIPPITGGQLTVIKGVSGYHGRDLPEQVRESFVAAGVDVSENAIVLDEYAGVPSLGITLAYFIPAAILSLLGLYLLFPFVWSIGWYVIRYFFYVIFYRRHS